MKRIALLTESKYVAPEVVDWYVQQVLDEDRILQEALEACGFSVQRVAWSDADFNWNTVDVAVFRACWDYFHRFSEFNRWLDVAAGATLLFNSPELIRWNRDKHYLDDLKNRGVNVVTTVYLKRNSNESFTPVCAALGESQFVVKPTVSGAARHTHRFSIEEATSVQALLHPHLQEEDFMIQPFIRSIVEEGELSLVVINGKVTHAVRKIARAGDFRVQDDFGGSVHPHVPLPDEIAFAENAVRACPEFPIYARVDMVRDNQGQWAVSELELIEPELWFRHAPHAASQLAQALLNTLQPQ
ncbi:MAG: hypothetical protein RL226_2094 [Bacteroidota bacterium]